MINLKTTASEIGVYSTIKLSTELIEAITNSRLKAKDVLNDSFFKYSNILRMFPETNISAIYIIGSKNQRCIKFNIHRYLDYIFKYYGSTYSSDVFPKDYLKEFRGKLTHLESAKKIRDIHKISSFMFKTLTDRVKSAIFNLPESQKYKNYLNYSFNRYCVEGGDIPEDLEKIIEDVLKKYKDMEVKTLLAFIGDIEDNFYNLSSVPNHYLANISDFDFKILAAYSALTTESIKNKDDIQEFVGILIKDNVYSYLNGYSLDFSIIRNGEKTNVSLKFNDIISLENNKYGIRLNKSQDVTNDVELPKLKSDIVKNKIINKNEVVQLPKSFFQEMPPNDFIERIANTKRKIRKIDYERNVDPEALFQKKVDLYSIIEAEKLFMGTDSFDGYFGFQLPNGYVILDKFFADSSQNVISISDAIYVISVKDFEKMNSMSKTETFHAMQDGLINGTRWYHAADWEEKVMSLASTDDVIDFSVLK